MRWTIETFQKRADDWKTLMESVTGFGAQGKQCYAARQVALWDQFTSQAKKAFEICLIT
jgi:hypothetical protein